jgi:GTP-binding protein
VYLIDLPGYGYARGGPDSATELALVADAYFAAADADQKAGGGARATLHLIDSRHPGLDSDLAAARWLDSVGASRQVVATKIDKLSRSERTRNLREIERIFGTAALPVSATSGEGLDDLWRLIARLARATDLRK